MSSKNIMDIFALFPLNKRSAIFILVSLYVHNTSTCGIVLPSIEKLSPTMESSIFILCFAIIAAKYDWWQQKLAQFRIMKLLPVMVLYNSLIALLLANLAENFCLVPLHRLKGVVADQLANGAIKLSQKEWDPSELSAKIGCMLQWGLSLAFLFFTLTNGGGVVSFIRNIKKYIRRGSEDDDDDENYVPFLRNGQPRWKKVFDRQDPPRRNPRRSPRNVSL